MYKDENLPLVECIPQVYSLKAVAAHAVAACTVIAHIVSAHTVFTASVNLIKNVVTNTELI